MTEQTLQPGYRMSQMASIKGDRTRHRVTFNPNKASPGEEIYVNVPKLKPSSCLVPGSFHFLYDFEVTGVKT